ncbi:MAG: RNA pseudouridine synthase [Oscillospiraceae bacterium]|nr:RNA pseudouridine synthase [Oscillospiraceae bacterium]
MGVEILYQDESITVCIKPVGLDSEHELPQALGGEIYTLHRLDKNVGGVMVYARTKAAAAQLSQAIQNGAMVKEYVAMVHGAPPENGDWEDWLFKDNRKNKVYVVKKQRASVKKARLTYRVLSMGEQSLVRVRLYTGRSHQIRVQFASRGFPLVGDHKYGSRDDAKAPMLFSSCLRFPYKGKEVCFEALPDWAVTQ